MAHCLLAVSLEPGLSSHTTISNKQALDWSNNKTKGAAFAAPLLSQGMQDDSFAAGIYCSGNASMMAASVVEMHTH